MLDDLVSDDERPGELVHVGAAVAVPEHPPVVPGLVERAEVLVNDPGRRLVRVAEPCPLVGELPQVVIQRAEHVAGDLRPVVGGPTPDDRVEPLITAWALVPRRDRSSARSRSRIRLTAALL